MWATTRKKNKNTNLHFLLNSFAYGKHCNITWYTETALVHWPFKPEPNISLISNAINRTELMYELRNKMYRKNVETFNCVKLDIIDFNPQL